MVDKSKYSIFLKEIADTYLDSFETQGYANPGNNGPYGHIDTPARNTAHWCITLGYLWKEFGDSRYYTISRMFAEYLIELHKTSVSGAVKCMDESSYNHLNGLIGQAWIIEALVYFFGVSKEKKYLNCAEEIFRVPLYSRSQHMWEMIELDGRNIGLDYTFNHQLWFAAAGSMILQYKNASDIHEMIISYLDGCLIHLQVHKDGLIKHYGDLSSPFNHDSELKKRIKRIAKQTLFRGKRFENPNRYDADGYERGYHLFNLYAFSILRKDFASHPIYSSKKLQAAIDYGKLMDVHNDYFNVGRVLSGYPKAVMNKYAYAYNSPAFEYPYIYQVFGDENFENMCDKLYEIQLAATYDEKSKRLRFNNYDSETLTARVYELVRFLEYKE